MATLTWRPQALNDLEAIEAYYQDVAPDYAEILVAGMFERTQQLKRLPHLGRVVPEIGDEAIRELIYRDYRIMYIVDAEGERVEILTVLHSSRQFGTR
jgi:plasmid stabilization system protein ParE